MKLLKALLPVFCCLVLFPAAVKAQSGGAELSLKARVSGFQGRFGETYSAIGVEPALTIRPQSMPRAAIGLSYSKSMLNFDATSDMEADMHLFNLHSGVKGTVATHFHPFAYAMVGMRFMNYTNLNAPTDTDSKFTSVSLGLGGKAGVQIGKNNWRFETTIEYLTGTNSRYLTPEAFNQAVNQGRNVREFTKRSLITSFTVGAGIAFVMDWDKIPQE
ncbi:hypothetical protein H7F15_11885 [Pontibacter sp. Tf4]|uniref:hypothetical protein n=1 Tax=Pontibacter sp. Tf4 TaxID=2761620 RepID=UPI0016256DFA|nr:hypothetical protein [Pontibacter sp. Tf4]MBB6611741.1 hypothetical protein [Pontibacter sp. Tf4]